jgi:DNA-binding protein H-NS
MARVNVDKMSLKQLVDLEAKLNSAIPAARERERAKVKQEMAVLAEKHGFSLRDLMGGRKGKLSAPKYANPDDPSQTWTGRGRKPNWLIAKVKKGGSKTSRSKFPPQSSSERPRA